MFGHHYLLTSSHDKDMILPGNIYYTIFIFGIDLNNTDIQSSLFR